MKRIILRTVDSTLASKDASLVMITLQRHLALMCQLTVELDFLAVDLSFPIVWAIAVLVEPFVMSVKMMRRSSRVKCEKAFVILM